MSILYVLAAILLLGILVVVHEFGHFIFARMCGIEVSEFAVGFGPKLFGWKSRKYDTKFSVRLIPMGGFCAFYGEDDAEGNHIDDPRAYAKQPVWKRMLSVIMGPGMNFVLAFVVLALFFWISGSVIYDPVIMDVEAGGPAYEAGMRANDVIESINGVSVLDGTTTTVIAAISGYDGTAPLHLVVRRAGSEPIEMDLTPFFDEAYGRYRAGVTIGAAPRTTADGQLMRTPISLGTALSGSWNNCVQAGTMILSTLKALVTTGQGFENTSGPVGVVTLVSREVESGGLEAFLNLLVLISINLGVMNLLPIPGLDGSRFLFMVLEAVRRKPIPPQKEAVVHLAGMAFLFALMIFFTFRDVANLFH